MARGSRGQRDISNPIANDPLLPLLDPIEPSPLIDPLVDDPLLSFEDRRFYHPAGYNRPALMSWSSDVVLGYANNAVRNLLYDVSGKRYVDRAKNYIGAAAAFRDPSRVAICVRRKVRREVLFALSPHRRIGSGRGKHRRRNWASSIRC